MSRGLQVGELATGTGLTSRQPRVDLQEEREQIAERDCRIQQDRELQITTGSAAEPISHLHLQEPMASMTIQLQRYVNEVHMMGLDALIQRTARPEPPKAVPPREQQEQLRLHGEWAGRPAFMRPKPFPRPPFTTSFSCTLSKWRTMQPPHQVCYPPIGKPRWPEEWPAQWAAAQAAHTAKGKGGFRAPSGPTFVPSALPQS